jgi:hypothetical protein
VEQGEGLNNTKMWRDDDSGEISRDRQNVRDNDAKDIQTLPIPSARTGQKQKGDTAFQNPLRKRHEMILSSTRKNKKQIFLQSYITSSHVLRNEKV